MSRLHRLIAAFFFLSMASSALADSSLPTRIYFLDGIDRKDGMSASIDFQNRRIAVAGDMVVMNKCQDSDPIYCFSSEYMSFSEPPRGEKSWVGAGSRFSVKEQKSIRIGKMDICAEVIFSAQKSGDFLFYFNRGVGLIGWKISYVTVDGQKSSDEYVIANVEGNPTECIN